MAQWLLVIGCAIFALLGVAHLFLTFFSDKFFAHDEQVTSAMKATSPRITKDTTMWKAWVGFNASHSLGPIVFALIYIPLAVSDFSVIQNSLWLSALPIIVGLVYLTLAKAYWFRAPLIGIAMATACFVASITFSYFLS